MESSIMPVGALSLQQFSFRRSSLRTQVAGVSEVISVLLMAAKQVHPFVLSEPLNQFLGSVSLYALTREVSDYVNM
jgi:hypothetical protein